MFDSPLSASAYEVLGVAADAPDEDLRRAYRLRLRATHPDTGGEAAVFIQVQRAWELVGAPDRRAAYDRGHGFADDAVSADAWHAPDVRADTRPRAKSYGEAGAQRRRLFVAEVTKWAGTEVADPYAPAFVRTVPRALRRLLADALAGERTARTIADLGMGFTAWHDVATSSAASGSGSEATDKLDHIVLGPSGLYGLTSADLGGIARFRGGEIIGPDPDAPAPITALLGRIRTVARAAGVRFTGGILVLPDEDLYPATSPLGTIRGTPVVVVRQSALRPLLREGFPGARTIGGTEVFDLRTRIRHAVRFA
ncbi:DnaJ domain-containing protein [uncultured Microbacterium sp.]|uniref:DnaJ domain-containing protein n=1 Tax=uncultured Microbacterium sp. TaxID=191216 RepID=UPI0025E61CC4|nr:DnaJ domain-containing protein [uncultured Microbacterium sp.]